MNGLSQRTEPSNRVPAAGRNGARSTARAIALAASIAAVQVLSGCASLPHDVQREVSTSIAADDATPLARIAANSVELEPQSGFRLIPDGGLALNARLELISRAQRSVDIQYYLIANDSSGQAVFHALRDAAVRGVRVRLLLDDLYTEDETDLLRSFAAFANVEVRLFNPFAGWRTSLVTRVASNAAELPRINHRMHNKLMVVDGAFALAGGRNVADAYFNRSKDQNLVDNDILVAGPLVQQLGDVFDTYWNNNYVFPLRALDSDATPTEQNRAQFDRLTSQTGNALKPVEDIVDVLGYGPIGAELDAGKLTMVPGQGFEFADLPSKISEGSADGLLNTASFDVVSVMHTAQSSIVISSPYFIPGKNGLALMADDKKRGVSVNVLTNSLASNDTVLAYIGYAPYRPQLLRDGVELYELSGKPFQRLRGFGRFSLSKGGLHAKEAVVDGHTVFIGSLNFDPRSRDENTELGIIIESPMLAAQLLKTIVLAEENGAYRVQLAADGNGLTWSREVDGKQTLLDTDPESGFWERLEIQMMSPFISEDLL